MLLYFLILAYQSELIGLYCVGNQWPRVLLAYTAKAYFSPCAVCPHLELLGFCPVVIFTAELG